MVTALDKTHDLVFSQDEAGWYIQEYANDGRGTSRKSKIYKTSRDAWTAYRDKTVIYS